MVRRPLLHVSWPIEHTLVWLLAAGLLHAGGMTGAPLEESMGGGAHGGIIITPRAGAEHFVLDVNEMFGVQHLSHRCSTAGREAPR